MSEETPTDREHELDSKTGRVVASGLRQSPIVNLEARWSRLSPALPYELAKPTWDSTPPLTTTSRVLPGCRLSGFKRANAGTAGMAPNTAWAHCRSRPCALFRSLNRLRTCGVGTEVPRGRPR